MLLVRNTELPVFSKERLLMVQKVSVPLRLLKHNTEDKILQKIEKI